MRNSGHVSQFICIGPVRNKVLGSPFLSSGQGEYNLLAEGTKCYHSCLENRGLLASLFEQLDNFQDTNDSNVISNVSTIFL